MIPSWCSSCSVFLFVSHCSPSPHARPPDRDGMMQFIKFKNKTVTLHVIYILSFKRQPHKLPSCSPTTVLPVNPNMSPSSTSTRTLLDLPDELINQILINLDGLDLASLTVVCTRLNALSVCPSLWRKACLDTPGFPKLQYSSYQYSPPNFWRLSYQQFHLNARVVVCPGCSYVPANLAVHRDPSVRPICFYLRNNHP